ncbi:permease [Calycomorphotria hydatis]|uniref:Putative permease n=1 Tax=Calycomorphotria hydatis TaxID=2528027 RepID=A0A517TE39_9PLAN|nr:permease [Calycomorphotria hydatis]QDT66641.1 putative permease [Calycomorphotria hydatis]
MDQFLKTWSDAALTTLGFFWMAFWAFALGYIVSSCIQVFVTKERMKQSLGEAGPKSVALATFFGFISSSCSFAALATAKSLFKKGAGLVPALAFLLASTNLVIELGIIIAIFLSWQFVAAEYIGGLLLILCMWIIVKLTLPPSLEQEARQQVNDEGESEEIPNWREMITSKEGWTKVAKQYFMEWGMVWRDVTFGFTVAGVIAAFVPDSFFTTLFPGSGTDADPAFGEVLVQTIVGPVAAFFTFIGSMGNIPLASILYTNGVSFAGVMAFIFSDLVVFPVLRIMSKYFGWKMAFYILGVFLVSLICSALALHYGFAAFDLLPEGKVSGESVKPSERFAIDYAFFLNIAFVLVTGVFYWLKWSKQSLHDGHDHSSSSDVSWSDRLLTILAYASFLWLAGGIVAKMMTGCIPSEYVSAILAAANIDMH